MAQFDPKKIVVTYNGVPLIGMADGTFLTVERRNDSVDMYVGSTGESIAAGNQDTSGTAVVTLAGSSQSNDILSISIRSAEQGAMLPSVFQAKDLNGRTVVFSRDAYIMKQPSVTYGKTGSDMNREWTIVCGHLDFIVGGSALINGVPV